MIVSLNDYFFLVMVFYKDFVDRMVFGQVE